MDVLGKGIPETTLCEQFEGHVIRALVQLFDLVDQALLPGTIEFFCDIRLTLTLNLKGVGNSLGFLDIVDTSLLILSNLGRNSLRVEINQLNEAKRSFSPASVNLGQEVGISGIRFKLIFKSGPTPDKV